MKVQQIILDGEEMLARILLECSHVQAFALRPILGDVQGGERGPEERREAIRRFMRAAAGQVPRTLTPRWLGFGPTLVNRKDYR
jgi:hypothetical protein